MDGTRRTTMDTTRRMTMDTPRRTTMDGTMRMLLDGTMPSITLAPHEMRNIMVSSERSDLTIREMMEDSSVTGVVLKAREPWRDAYSKLHYDFLDSVQAHTSELQIFETVADFIRNCTDTLELMRGSFSYFPLPFVGLFA